jgi:hypothetical protein
MAAINNVSPSFLWMVTRDNNSHLLRRPAGVGDLSTSPLNPTGIQSSQFGAAYNVKHASVTAHPSGEGFVLHRITRRNANKPAKRYSATHFNNLKGGQIDKFRSLVKAQINRRDLNNVSVQHIRTRIACNSHDDTIFTSSSATETY